MKVLVIGKGGREHALAWRIFQAAGVSQVYVSPGNMGMQGPCLETVSVNEDSIDSFLKLAKEIEADLTVVGPEMYLEQGIVDLFQDHGLLIYGPSRQAALLESSKVFAKRMMRECGIPTADFGVFSNSNEAFQFIEDNDWGGYVVKCDALAAGKGVIVCSNKADAKKAVVEFLVQDKLGIETKSILIENRLVGPEVSHFFLCAGEEFISLASACDYKKLAPEAGSPNTGGMGAYAPAAWVTQKTQTELENGVRALLRKMNEQGRPFYGTLFVGAMVVEERPYILEYNVRFGDPETQVIMPILNADTLLNGLISCAKRDLESFKQLSFNDPQLVSVHVVKAAFGYPGTEGLSVRKGDLIQMNHQYFQELEEGKKGKGFFAGVKSNEGILQTSGGRVLGVTCTADTKEEARKLSYLSLGHVHFKGEQFRDDIAY